MFDDFDPAMLQAREDHAATQGFFGGLLLGAILGVVLALILAPRRGDETRTAIVHAASEASHKAVDLVDKATGRGQGATTFDSHEPAIEREIG